MQCGWRVFPHFDYLWKIIWFSMPSCNCNKKWSKVALLTALFLHLSSFEVEWLLIFCFSWVHPVLALLLLLLSCCSLLASEAGRNVCLEFHAFNASLGWLFVLQVYSLEDSRLRLGDPSHHHWAQQLERQRESCRGHWKNEWFCR